MIIWIPHLPALTIAVFVMAITAELPTWLLFPLWPRRRFLLWRRRGWRFPTFFTRWRLFVLLLLSTFILFPFSWRLLPMTAIPLAMFRISWIIHRRVFTTSSRLFIFVFRRGTLFAFLFVMSISTSSFTALVWIFGTWPFFWGTSISLFGVLRMRWASGGSVVLRAPWRRVAWSVSLISVATFITVFILGFIRIIKFALKTKIHID